MPLYDTLSQMSPVSVESTGSVTAEPVTWQKTVTAGPRPPPVSTGMVATLLEFWVGCDRTFKMNWVLRNVLNVCGGGVSACDTVAAWLVPAAFTAVTENVYVALFISPVTWNDVPPIPGCRPLTAPLHDTS